MLVRILCLVGRHRWTISTAHVAEIAGLERDISVVEAADQAESITGVWCEYCGRRFGPVKPKNWELF